MIPNGATIWARQTLESDIFFLKPDKWFKIWFYLVSKVNHTENGKFKRGEALLRYSDIMEACGATKSQVDHAIRWFKKCQMLATRKATRGMFVTVLKYNTYQNLDSYKSDSSGDLKAKPKRNKSDTINKNEKNEKNEKKTTKVNFPLLLNTPDFIKAWDEWEKHRKEIKKKLTPSTISKQLKMLSSYPTETAIATIETSIQNGWTGLFPEKANYGNGQTTTTNNSKPKKEAYTGKSAFGVSLSNI